MQRECAHCGKQFEVHGKGAGRTSYCCEEHRTIRQTLLRRQHRSMPEMREYLLIKQREWRARNIKQSREIARNLRAKNADRLNEQHRKRGRYLRASYRILAEMVGGSDNLNRILEERNLI